MSDVCYIATCLDGRALEVIDVASLIANFTIHGGANHCDVIYASACNRLLGTPQDEGVLKLTWYRCTESGAFDEILGVSSGLYQPSADDVGCKICARITNLSDESMQSFQQINSLECCKNLSVYYSLPFPS